jgi:hypothetical protein
VGTGYSFISHIVLLSRPYASDSHDPVFCQYCDPARQPDANTVSPLHTTAVNSRYQTRLGP